MDIFIMWNLGLGDAILCNGLVRSLLPQYERIYVPAFSHNMPSVKFMFSDEPKILVQEVGTPNEIFIMQVFHAANGVKVLKLGCYSGEPHKEPESYDQTLYRQAEVDLSRRWDGFKLPETRETIYKFPTDKKSIALICDSDERGFRIDDSKISNEHLKFRPWKAEKIFDFTSLIGHVNEIHCINSAFAILADSIPTTGKLFMHRYSRPYTPYDNFKLRKRWEILA